MKTSTIALTTLSTLLSLTSGAALPSKSLNARTPGADVTICTGENYTGDCQNLHVPFDGFEEVISTCQTVPAPFYKNTGSFKVAPGAYCRLTYTADSCTSHGDAFVFPNPPSVGEDARTLRHYLDPATQTTVDAGSGLTSFTCQICTACVE